MRNKIPLRPRSPTPQHDVATALLTKSHRPERTSPTGPAATHSLRKPTKALARYPEMHAPWRILDLAPHKPALADKGPPYKQATPAAKGIR